MTYTDTVIDIEKEVVQSGALFGGHSGGDYAIMHDITRFFNGDAPSPSLTPISDSIDGHFIVYAAEESRRKDEVVKMKEFKERF